MAPPAHFKTARRRRRQARPSPPGRSTKSSPNTPSPLLGREIHELRQMTSVDGKPVAGETQAQDALAKLITSQRRRTQAARAGATGKIRIARRRHRLRPDPSALQPRQSSNATNSPRPARACWASWRRRYSTISNLDGPHALTVFRGTEPARQDPTPQRRGRNLGARSRRPASAHHHDRHRHQHRQNLCARKPPSTTP